MVAAISLLLAQDLGVVDFDDLEAGAAGGGPELRDAAVAAHFLRGSRQQQQQRAPGFRVGGGVERQRGR